MKNLLKINLIIILLIFFVGCGRKQLEIVYSPELNKITTTEIGKNMYEKTYARTIKIVNFKGREYKFAKLDDAECAMYNGSESLLDYNCDGYFTHKRGSLLERGKEKNKLQEPIKYEVKNRYYPVVNSFKYEVIYQGRVGSQIKVAYREFYFERNTNSFMVRPAFEQIIEYEIAENGSTIIGFKGLRIEVVKATNMDIAYRVIKDYD